MRTTGWIQVDKNRKNMGSLVKKQLTQINEEGFCNTITQIDTNKFHVLKWDIRKDLASLKWAVTPGGDKGFK